MFQTYNEKKSMLGPSPAPMVHNPTNWSSESPVVQMQRYGNPIKGAAPGAASVTGSDTIKTGENTVTPSSSSTGFGY